MTQEIEILVQEIPIPHKAPSSLETKVTSTSSHVRKKTYRGLGLLRVGVERQVGEWAVLQATS